MLEPNFSESQLQQAVNSAFIRLIFEECEQWAFANVPSLFDEFWLGWDSAFYFPWLPHPSLEEHEGCNFFIQYKLSYELTTGGAGQWEYWKEPYLRFKIPHKTKGPNGKHQDDFHQWERLKELANQNYPTYYATNSTLNKDNLKEISKNGSLLSKTPFLDVRDITQLHKYVTFKQKSDFFLLHSEIEKTSKVSSDVIFGRLRETRKNSLSESNRLLYRSLEELAVNDESWRLDLRQISDSLSSESELDKVWIVRSLLSNFVRHHIGAHLYWYPTHG